MDKEWEVLLHLEYEWRLFRYYRKLLHYLVKRKMRLSSPILCFIQKRMDKHSIRLMVTQRLYEQKTGVKIVYYKYNDI